MTGEGVINAWSCFTIMTLLIGAEMIRWLMAHKLSHHRIVIKEKNNPQMALVLFHAEILNLGIDAILNIVL